jgi:branched-chain amino acid transport system substrate-binding protein
LIFKWRASKAMTIQPAFFPVTKRVRLACLGVVIAVAYILTGTTLGHADGRRFRLGVSCPLSGVLAEYGTAVRNGIELARTERPEVFSRVEVIYEDSQWDPKTAIGAFRVLTTQKGADLVFNWGNPTSEAIAPLAERGGVATIVMSSDPSISKGKRFVTRSINASTELGQVIAREVQRRGFSSIGVVLAENSSVRGVVAGLEQSLPSTTTVTVVDRVPLDAQDFRSVISKMKSRNYDALGVMLISGQISAFYRQMKAQNFERPSFGADFLDSRAELAAAGPAVEGAFHPNFDVTDDFRSKYLAAFKNDSQIPFAANAYDVVNLAANLFATTPVEKLSPQSVVEAIRAVRNYKGANGDMSVVAGEGQDYFFQYPLIRKEARGGQSVVIR